MPSKYDLTRATFDRAHSDLFGDARYSAEFFNYTGGSYDPDIGDVTGESRDSLGSVNVEIVPPSIDSTVRQDGTSFSFDTSIRLPLGTGLVSDFIPLGEDNDRPTEVEITDEVDNSTEMFELHGYRFEKGSGFVMVRLIEQ